MRKGKDLQNLEIITEDGGNTSLMGAEPEYIVITGAYLDTLGAEVINLCSNLRLKHVDCLILSICQDQPIS